MMHSAKGRVILKSVLLLTLALIVFTFKRTSLNNNWVEDLKSFSRKITSQNGQDGIIEEVFRQIHPRNKRFVEFGFGYAGSDVQAIERRLNGTNSYQLKKNGWKGWFFDALLEYPSIGLFRETLTPRNIVTVFKKYGIPRDVDYISIDVDSVDLWLLRALLGKGGYLPQLISIEFNPNFPYYSTISCDPIWEPWAHDIVYGTSIGAIKIVAERAGYDIVHVESNLDVFLVRRKVLLRSGATGLNDSQLMLKFPLPRHCHSIRPDSKLQRFIDYKTYDETGDIELSRKVARQNIEHMRTFLESMK